MQTWALTLLLGAALPGLTTGFAVRAPGAFAKPRAPLSREPLSRRAASPNDEAKDAAAPTNLDRLKEESANPFRTFRLFLYGASGASALIGGLTSCAQLAGTVGDAPAALPLATVVTNLGVDFGVVAAAVALYRFENGNRDAELADAVRGDVLKKAPRVSKDAMAQREAVLQDLPLTVAVDASGDTKRATVAELQGGARQHVVVVAGSKAMVKESLMRAKVMGARFATQGVLIVPVVLGGSLADDGSGSKGFGAKGDTAANQLYVARPDGASGDGAAWAAYVGDELASAAEQAAAAAAAGVEGADAPAARGIVIVCNRDGKVVRRGLGVPAWDKVVTELNQDPEKTLLELKERT